LARLICEARLRAWVEPAKLFQQAGSAGSNGMQYIVREAEAERAPEIAGEFYPNDDAPLR
jgi:hypothetical protein